MTDQIPTEWVAWFERDQDGLIVSAGVDTAKDTYNVCVTTNLDREARFHEPAKVIDKSLYNRTVMCDTNLIAAAPKLRQSLESLLDAVRRTDAGDDSAWPERDAAMEEAEALLTSLKASN